MSWRILYIEESDYLSLYLDNVKVVKNEEELLVPISDMNTIILDNYKITLSVHLMIELTKQNVNIVVCNLEHLPHALIIPFGGASQTSINIRKQIEWDEMRKAFVHQSIIKAKIKNQLTLLKTINKNTDTILKLEQYMEEVALSDKTNREGLAAKMYFKAIFGNEFKRFDDDIINAGLNYGYAILRSLISKTILVKGYHTSLGFFHKGPNNLFNLSDGFIETFRPIVDYWVHKNLIKEKIFLREHRFELVKLTTSNIFFNDSSQSIFNAMRLYIDHVISYVESEDNFNILHPIIKYDEL